MQVANVYRVLIYDINHKRFQKVMKICRKYLNHLQNSVFEGNIAESKLGKLKTSFNRLLKLSRIQSVFSNRKVHILFQENRLVSCRFMNT